MNTVISKHEARYTMAQLGRVQEFDELLYVVLPDLVDEWTSSGVALSIEHCFVRHGAACLLRIDCIGSHGAEHQFILLNGDKQTLAIFPHTGRTAVVSWNRFKQHISNFIVLSAQRLGRNSAGALPASTATSHMPAGAVPA